MKNVFTYTYEENIKNIIMSVVVILNACIYMQVMRYFNVFFRYSLYFKLNKFVLVRLINKIQNKTFLIVIFIETAKLNYYL